MKYPTPRFGDVLRPGDGMDMLIMVIGESAGLDPNNFTAVTVSGQEGAALPEFRATGGLSDTWIRDFAYWELVDE